MITKLFHAVVTCCVVFTILSSVSITHAYAGGVVKQEVTFESDGVTLKGHLYLPEGVQAGEKVPGVVVTGAWTTIKEQMPGLYAQEMAKRGLAALAFDFRTWGESGGETRSLEDPQMKIADIEAAARFLASRPEVTQVNGLGICASAGSDGTRRVGSPE